MTIKLSKTALTVNGKRAGIRFAAGPWIEGVPPETIKIRAKAGRFPEGFRSAFAVENNSDGPEGERTYGGGVLVVAYTPDGLFGLFQKPGHWPFVEKLSNCRFLVADAKARGVA